MRHKFHPKILTGSFCIGNVKQWCSGGKQAIL